MVARMLWRKDCASVELTKVYVTVTRVEWSFCQGRTPSTMELVQQEIGESGRPDINQIIL
jgi:hypothetical protein